MLALDKVRLVETVTTFSHCAATQHYRYVAQPGSALSWGVRGRRFESSHTDHIQRKSSAAKLGFFVFIGSAKAIKPLWPLENTAWMGCQGPSAECRTIASSHTDHIQQKSSAETLGFFVFIRQRKYLKPRWP